MHPSMPSRRSMLVAGASLGVGLVTTGSTTTFPTRASRRDPAQDVRSDLRDLEDRYGARLGVFGYNVRTRAKVAYRSDERFAICSVFKGLAAAHVLRDFDRRGEFLDRVVHYTEDEVVEHSPITGPNQPTGMRMRDICAAAISVSDNTAGNLMMRETGGPAGLTRFFRSIGDPRTRLDRWETELNTSYPGDLRDTTTPAAVGRSYGRLILGRALNPTDRCQLTDWLKASTTNTYRFRAGLPADWVLADKTGGGGYGSGNDVGVVWTSVGTPLVLSVLTVRPRPDDVVDNALIADAAGVLARRLAPGE